MKQGWEIKKLSEVCELAAGGDVPKDNFSEIQTEIHQIPIYANGEKNDGLYGFTSTAKVTKPSITVAARGTIGFSVKRLKPFFPVVRLIVVTPIDINKLDLDFLDYALKTIDFKHSGSSIPQLTVPMIRDYNILIPLLPEQRRIVSILDEAFSAIERSRNNAEQNLKNAKELFESYLQGVFENGNWETKTIQEVTKVINGYAFASKDFKPTNSIKSIKITNVGVKEFIEEADNYLPEKFKDTLQDVQVKQGNIVIALTRTIISAGLKVAVVPESYDGALVNQRVAALIPKEKLVNQNFLYYYLTTSGVAKYVLDHVNTLMQPNLSINDLKNMPVPIPTVEKQQSIVRQLETLRAETKKLEAIYQQKLLNLEELKKSILQKAFAGELKTEKELAV